MKKWILWVVVVQPVFGALAAGNEEAELKRRVQQLEQQTETLKKRHELFVDSITKTINEGALAQDSALELERQMHSRLKASGYADVEYRDTSDEQSSRGFRVHHFSLILTKQIDEHWRSFAEIEYEDAPRVEFEPGAPGCVGDCSGQIFVEAMNVDYSPSDLVGIRVGRFFTPAGIWSIDHYPPFVSTQERPLLTRHIFPQVIDGALLHGVVPVRELFFNYDVYVGNGESSTAHGDNDNTKSRGARASTQLPWLTHFELGASAYADTLVEEDQHRTGKLSMGVHAKARQGALAFQTEIARTRFRPEDDVEHTSDGYYAQLGFDAFTATTIGYRYETFEDFEEDALGAIATPEIKRDSYFLNYRAHKNVVLKLEHHITALDGADKEALTVASIAVYLGE